MKTETLENRVETTSCKKLYINENLHNINKQSLKGELVKEIQIENKSYNFTDDQVLTDRDDIDYNVNLHFSAEGVDLSEVMGILQRVYIDYCAKKGVF